MSTFEAQALLVWLMQIGESDQNVIADVVRDSQHDVGARAFFLNLAAEAVSSGARFFPLRNIVLPEGDA